MKGRPAHVDPPVGWFINIPESLSNRVELLLWDPAANGPRKGARSALVRSLLERYLKEKGIKTHGEN